MIEPEEQDRWNALAEELGLPTEPSQKPTPIPAAPAAQGSAATHPVEVFEPPPTSSLPSPNLAEGGEEKSPVRSRRRRNIPTAEAEMEGTAEPVSSEEVAEAAETLVGEERPRRRRRVRGNKKPRKRTTDEASAAAAETEEAGEEERPRRRRRRRGKKTEKESETPPAAEMEEESIEETPPQGPAPDEEEDEEIEDFSTWNVPSWAEIIAGLYRPEH